MGGEAAGFQFYFGEGQLRILQEGGDGLGIVPGFLLISGSNTSLQRDANRQLGYTAQQTLDYTQSLYEKKLVTYPRGWASSPAFSSSAAVTYARQPGSVTVFPLDLNWCPAHSSVTAVSE